QSVIPPCIVMGVTCFVALFDAQKTNMLTAEPDTGLSATLGQVESQGIEFQLTTELTDETVLALAYTYTDAKTANDVINADWSVPIPKGSRLINIADHIGHVSLKHYTTFLGKESYLGATKIKSLKSLTPTTT
ncbi:TonB-dependent receptor, partial [Pseudoalteromonas sp. S2755]|uniref:TonB-dependent receptor domain-containing protein n=1 Tax=Pseudoalteromonas sp. S2755 TaxID=2066523 RepID=UPI0020168F6F